MQPKEEEPDYSTCLFDQFMHANTFRTIISAFTDLCEFLEVKPNDFKSCYPYLKNRLTSWKAKTLWAKLDKKAKHKDYKGGKACTNTKVLIIGAGPCGLRSAIDASLLGAKVVVVEKRDRFSRNNVLHLWPYVIEDLRSLGAKKFYGKFCAGSIDHISIRQLQCMLLKVSLLFGVEVHGNTAFEGLIEPPENQEEERIGWRAHISPPNHPIADYEFDVLIGADGKRNTLGGFKRKEFRGKLAIAITANFVNRHTKAETRVEEISGVAYIFNQKFFKDLKAQTRIDLENIVYYKDETHYFVMTAKKSSLLEKGVLLQDYAEAEQLLCGENISQEALLNYAREAADFSTNQKLPRLDFALNHYGLPDVAMFDFTSMYAAENAARVVERNNSQLLVGLVGDSLLEPFWPTGSGCARGFLGCADASWMIRSWASGRYSPLEVLAERESIYRLLAQTTPENLNKDLHQYSVDPKTRYPNLNTAAVEPASCILLYDNGKDVICEEMLIEKSRPKLQRKMSVIRTSKLLQWCKMATENYSDVSVENMTSSWKSGLALCAIIHRFRPGLIDFHSLKQEDIASNNQLAFDVAEKEFGIMPVMTGIEMASVEEPDKLTMVAYLSQFYEALKEELPVQSSAENRLPEEEFIPGHKSPGHRASLLAKLQKKFHKKSLRREDGEEKENQKRRSLSGSKRRGKDQIDLGKKFEDLNSEKQKDWDKKEDLDVGVRGANRVSAMADSLFAQFQEIAGVKPSSGDPVNRPKSKQYSGATGGSDFCFFCGKRVYVMERLSAEGLFFHRGCFKCHYCQTTLRIGNYAYHLPPNENKQESRFFCRPHFKYSKLSDGGPRKRRIEEAKDTTTIVQAEPVKVIPERPTSPVVDEPMEKKYKTTPDVTDRDSAPTPERIFLDSTLDRSMGVLLTEEEVASYNYGDSSAMDEDYESSSDDYEDDDTEDEYSEGSDYDPIQIPEKYLLKKPVLLDPPAGESEGEESEDDDESWDESEEEELDYESDDEDMSEEELLPVEEKANDLQWKEPTKQEIDVVEEAELEDAKDKEKTEPEAAGAAEVKGEAADDKNESPEERYDHKAQVASITSLKLQWLTQPEPPDHSQWGRRSLPKPTPPKLVFPEEEKPPPVPPLPSQEDLAKANIIDAEDSESKKEADSKGKEETGDAAVKEKGKEEQSYEGHRNKQQEDSDSDGEILVPTFDTTTFKTKLEIEEGEIEASEESEGEFLVEVGTKTGVDFVDGSVTKDDEGESSGLDRTSSLDGSGSLDMVEEEFVSLEWKDAESVARELESQQVDKDGVLGEAFEENLAEIYGETLKNLDEEGSDSAVKDERAQVSSESSREPSVDSDELREKVDSVPSEGEGSVEEGHIDVNLEQPESTNLQDNSREKVDYVEDDLADVYGDTLARLEAKGETPVEEKNIAEIFTFEKVHVDDVEEGEVLEEHFDLERQTPRTNYARKNLVTQEEMLSGGALQPGEAPTEISFIDDVDTDSPVEEEKPSPAPLARDEEFSDSDVEEGEILIESGSTHGKDSDILDSIERDDNESAGVAADNRNEVKAVNDVAHLRVADNFDNTPQKTPELNLDITNVTRRAKPKLLQLEKTDIENLGPATESPRSPGASSTASSTLETDTLKSYQEELMNISKLDNLQDSLQIDSSLPPEKDVPRSGEASEINESQRSVEDIDVAFKTINEAVTKDTSTDLTDVSFETADSSLRYDDSFLDGLDKTSRTSTMSSKPDSTFSRDSIDSINADLHISIMSSDSESGDSAKATLEMYARELEYQSIRDEGDDIVAASPREEVKPLPGMTPKAKENDSITEVDSVQRNSKTSEDKNEAQVPKSKKEMKPPPLKMSQPPKHSVSKGKVYTTFDESFNDIPAVDKVEDRVSQEKSGVVQKTPAKVPVKRGNKEKVKGKAKKYVVPDDGIWDEEFYTPMTTVTKNTFSAKGDSDYKGTAKAKAQDKKKAVEASASPSLKYRPLPVPQGQKDTKPVPQKGSASPRLYKGKKDDKKTNGTTSPKVSTTPKGSREPSPSVTAGNGKVVFNKSGKAKKSEKEKEDRMEQKPPKSPQKSPKERKGKKPLSKNREELKKINLDEKSKTPTKAKVAASSLDDSAKSKKSSKKKTDEMPMGEIRSAKKQTPVKKAPTKAPLAKLDLSDDLLSDGDLTPVESVVKPKASAGTPRPLPPRPSSLSATDSIRGVVVDDLSSDTSEDELSAVTPTESHSSDKKKKSKRKSLAKKLKVFKRRKSKDKSSAKFTEEELNEKLTKKVQKAARKQHRQQELRRLRMAQEIQRHLQEVEVKQRMLEDRGVELEKSFRGESSDEKDDEGTLMQEWFSLINEKNSLVRFEQELTIQAKELELEDRHSRLQQELRERMAIDDTKKTKEDQDHEKKLLEEMLEVVEQRDKLVVLLEEERLKEKEEDKDVETMMLKKGFLVASS
ncbi:F-actin-monooxygenase MICAL3-like isoform X3 [Ptychodera flava]|uniref:F-actin-monooxygenase MICAL3-like isoform X3 n=1 Tax=Ptychodera flava TaxID=63121 RepID=UPI00396AADDE